MVLLHEGEDVPPEADEARCSTKILKPNSEFLKGSLYEPNQASFLWGTAPFLFGAMDEGKHKNLGYENLCHE